MKRTLCLALMLWSTLGVARADEPGVCKSMCSSEQRACRKDAVKLTDLDKLPAMTPDEKNPLARAASQGQMTSAQERAAEQDDYYRRRSERTGHCDTAFQQCVRDCAAQAASPGTSEVLTKQGQAKRKGAESTAR